MADKDMGKTAVEDAPSTDAVGDLEYPPELMAKARQWFKQGSAVADTRNYDYAMKCYLQGMEFWPEAVEEAWQPLREVAMKRALSDGKKPGLMETMKYSHNGKDAKRNLINAATLWAKDPSNSNYLEAIAKNATEMNLSKLVRWVGPMLFEQLVNDKKVTPQRFLMLGDLYERTADTLKDEELALAVLEKALTSCQIAINKGLNNLETSMKVKDLAAKMTMRRGNYEKAKSFRDSIKDAEKQKDLAAMDQVVRTDEQHGKAVAAARKIYDDAPTVPAKIRNLVDLLCQREKPEEELEAIDILNKAYEATKDYGYRARQHDIKLKQARRRLLGIQQKAASATGDEKKTLDEKIAKLQADIGAFELKMLSERVENYPTDMTVRYQYGAALLRAHRYDDAIPVFQASKNDPKNKVRSLNALGQCFFASKFFSEAADTFKEALDNHETPDDALGKELCYNQGRSYEELGDTKSALACFSRVVQLEFGYKDARDRIKRIRDAAA